MKKYVQIIVCTLAMALLMPYITIAYAQEYVTKDENGVITYDISEYVKANYTSDTAVTEETYPGLEGLIFHTPTSGSNWWITKKRSPLCVDIYTGGYIAYTAPSNGTLSVKGSPYKSRYVGITDDISNPEQNIILPSGHTADTIGGIDVVENKTYYIMSNGTGVAKIIFTPEKKEENEDSDSIRLNYSTYPLYVGNSKDFNSWNDKGASVTLEAQVISGSYNVSDIVWNVTDDSILKITSQSDGTAKVQALRTGIAQTVASLPDGSEKCCYISVIDNYTRLTTQRIEFNIDELNLKTGENATVLPIIYPKDLYNNGMLDKTLVWNSSDTNIAMVDNGIITAVSAGTAKITVTSADVGRSASMTVTVSDSASAQEITASSSETVNMTVGTTQKLSAECEGDIIWKSDNSYVADVDENGVVTAYSKSAKQTLSDNGINMKDTPDTVKIYATAKNGGNMNVFNVAVSDAPVTVQAVEINKDKINIVKGLSKNITASILPANLVNAEVEWSSSDENVAVVAKTNRTVDGVNQAVVTAKGAGSATITASCEGKTDTCSVTVTDNEVKIQDIILPQTAEIDIDEVYKLNAEITSNAANQELIWISEDSDIATIDIDGTVMGYSAGTVKIYAIAADSLTEAEISKIKADKKSGVRQFDDTGLEGKKYSVCNITVKNSSPYLRNTHVDAQGITYNSINVLWNRASLTDAPNFDKYKVYLNGELKAETTTLGYTFNDLEPNTEYTFKIDAINTDGEICASETVTAATKPQPQILNVLDYGAVGNGKVTDTYAIQKAINECPENGIVLLPKGFTFYCGALFLKSNMTLQVDGTLLGSTDPKDYPQIVSRWEGWRKLPQSKSEWANTYGDDYRAENEYTHASLINIGTHNEGEAGEICDYNIHNVVICGEGQINGNGYTLAYNEGPNAINNNKGWYKAPSPATDETTRGRTISMYNAENVYVKDVLVAYSPAWTNHVVYSNNITYDNVKVISAGDGIIGGISGGHLYNGDGIDPDSTRNMNIFNAFLRTGDDAVTLKSGRNKEGNELDKPCAFIRVADCRAEDALGGFGSGSETAAGSHDILYQNLSIDNAELNGIWFKTNVARGGIAENIAVRDVDVNQALSAIHIMNTYSSSKTNAASEYPIFRNAVFDNIFGSNLSKGIQLDGTNKSGISNLKIIHPHFAEKTACQGNYCSNFEVWDEENTVWTTENSSNIEFIYHSVLNDTELAIADNAVSVREINNENKIVKVISNTTKTDFLKELTSLLGGKQVYAVSSDTIDNDCKLTVTSESGEYSAEYSIEIIQNIINANLRNLSVKANDKELISDFAMNKTEYSADIARDISVVSVSAVPDDKDAVYVMKINGTEFDENATLIVGSNVITIDVTASDNSANTQYVININNGYFIAEDFSNVTDTWGFSGTNTATVNTEDEKLTLLPTKNTGTYTEKTFDSQISTLNNVHIKFDWQSNIEKNNGRYSYFTLRDTNGNCIFGLYAHGKNGISYFTETYETTNKLEDFSNVWYTIDLCFDFKCGEFSGTVTNKDTSSTVKTFTNEPITTGAKNFSSMYAYDVYSAAPMSIDNVYILGEIAAVSEKTPEIKIDYKNEKLIGFDSRAEYTITVGEDFLNTVSPDNEGKLEISSAWFGKSLSIICKGNGETTTDSQPQMLVINARPSTPNVTSEAVTTVGGKDGKLIGATTSMEYRLLGTELWIDCTGTEIADLFAGTYEIRMKATDSTFSGETATILVYTECVKITATYENGVLKTIKIGKGLVSEAQSIDQTSNTKIFYWESLASMKPIEIK